MHGVVQYTVPLEPAGSRGVARLSTILYINVMNVVAVCVNGFKRA